jgi:beta-lactam-binding protein with PASTA domain
MLVRGGFRDRLESRSGTRVETPWTANLVVYRALDLIGHLLCNARGLAGICYLAVGEGDASWDASPPPADPARTRLTAETFRTRLEPGDSLTYDPASGRVHVRVSLGRGQATGTLRELGLFGGNASSRPGSGFLVNHKVHAPLEKGEDDVLERELFLAFDPALLPGARDLIGGLLSGSRGLDGITHVALGTSGDEPAEPPRELVAEAYRRPLDARKVAYDDFSHTVLATPAFEVGEGPAEVREAGLYGGMATERRATGYLVMRTVGDPVDRTEPRRLEQQFRLVLVTRTDVTVPDVTGQTLDEAHAALAAEDIVIGAIAEQESETAPGIVLDQVPAAGEVVNEATPVALVIAAPVLVTVPEIVGEPEQDVRTLLGRLGLTVLDNERVEVQSDRPPRTVLASTPPPGARVPKETGVALTVAVPRRVAVPDLRGRTPEAAGVLLAAAGLTVGPEPHATQESAATPGTIVAHEPPPGVEADVGTAVALTLATLWTVELPQLLGLELDGAASVLAAAAAELVKKLNLPPGTPGLALGTIGEREAAARDGTIVDQAPPAGTRASLYGLVDVTVAAATARAVPKLAGMTESGATAALGAAAFVLGMISHRASAEPEGTVLDQEPAPGVSWPRGARVAITLATSRVAVVPNVVGLALEAARESILARDLLLGTPTTEVDPGPPGVVLSQAPLARETVPVGSQVGVVVRGGMPNLVGMTEGEARVAVTAFGIALAAVRQREADGAPGIVLEQEPAAGSAVDDATRATLVVSALSRVAVLDVVGSMLEEAKRSLEAVGLGLVVGANEVSDVPAGSVLRQAPEAGQRVEQGSSVSVTIAVQRPRTVVVPDVLGLPAANAEAALAGAGLELAVEGARPSPGAEPGTVVEQKPAAGERVRFGSVVGVVLASADETTEVPDVRRRSVEEATRILDEAPLLLRVAGTKDSSEPEGTILSQDPLPASRVPAGSVVSVIVSAGGLIVVPNVVRLAEGAAVKALLRLGLRTKSTTQFDLVNPPGTVIDQEPPAETPVEPEAVVHLIVARRGLVELPGREPILIEPVPSQTIPPRIPLAPPGRIPP